MLLVMSKILRAKDLQVLQLKLITMIENGNYATIKFSRRPIKNQ